jgi:hypothetical protein
MEVSVRRKLTVPLLVLVAAVLWLPACSDAAPAPSSTSAGQGAGDAATPMDAATAAWDRALRAHGRRGGIDYAALKRDREGLDAYLDFVRQTDPASLSRNDRLAFWINAYNAVTVSFVLERYPGIESVRGVDGFFDELTFPVSGRAMTLDQIETAAREMDVRVHFAVVCASTSCPDLLNAAYVGGDVDSQLRRQTHAFLADEEKGLRYDAGGNDLYLSSIFKWYAGDFTGGSTVVAFFARGGVLDWVIEHLGDRELAATLEERDPSVKYMDYDWGLNDRP